MTGPHWLPGDVTSNVFKADSIAKEKQGGRVQIILTFDLDYYIIFEPVLRIYTHTKIDTEATNLLHHKLFKMCICSTFEQNILSRPQQKANKLLE